jgi:nucleoside-diphosphate-sugar epimerase
VADAPLPLGVFVTGASGFVGHAVCAALQARGHTATALVRRPGSEPPGTTAALGDLLDAGSLRSAVDHAQPDVIVHLAAEIATQRDAVKIERVNVGGTRDLLKAALASGNPRIVFVSTVVTGDAQGAVLGEETVLPVQTAYGRSKQRGEQLVRDSGLPWVIIRPGHIYGPGGWYAEEIVGRLRQPGRFAVVGRGTNLWDVVRVEDVAAACVAAAERAPDGSLFHVADDQPIPLYDFVALTARALSLGPPRRIPAGLARLVAGADSVRAVTRSARTSNTKLKRELGWSPAYPTAAEGVPDAVATLRSAT